MVDLPVLQNKKVAVVNNDRYLSLHLDSILRSIHIEDYVTFSTVYEVMNTFKKERFDLIILNIQGMDLFTLIFAKLIRLSENFANKDTPILYAYKTTGLAPWMKRPPYLP